MRTLTTREKRLLRFSSIGIVAYLLLFGGFKGWKALEQQKTDYNHLVASAQAFHQKVLPYESRAEATQKLMEDFKMDPARLARATVVAEASAAIQKVAQSGGVQIGPIRETPGRGTGRELATIQLEGTGQIPSVMGLLHQLERIGYPVIIDSVQITTDQRPGQLKLSLTLVVLDFDQWKAEEAANARS
jgi:hypothetical protein